MKKPINYFGLIFNDENIIISITFAMLDWKLWNNHCLVKGFSMVPKRRAGMPVVWEGCKMITSKQYCLMRSHPRRWSQWYRSSRMFAKNFLKNLISTYTRDYHGKMAQIIANILIISSSRRIIAKNIEGSLFSYFLSLVCSQNLDKFLFGWSSLMMGWQGAGVEHGT